MVYVPICPNFSFIEFSLTFLSLCIFCIHGIANHHFFYPAEFRSWTRTPTQHTLRQSRQGQYTMRLSDIFWTPPKMLQS